MKYRFTLLILLCLIFGIVSMQVMAQDTLDPDTCYQIIDEAFSQAATSCAANELGTACYGFPEAFSEYIEDTTLDPDSFSQPGDRIVLNEVSGFLTEPINLTSNTWGLVTINAQASLPQELIDGELDGKGLIYLVPGGINIKDTTAPDQVVTTLAMGIELSTIAAADMRVAPIVIDEDDYSNVVGRIPGESTVSADAITTDEEWVRVLFEGRPGWISTAVINPDADLSDLTTLGANSWTTMQSITFSVDPTVTSNCQTIPDGIIIQGPFEIPVDFAVEGFPVRLGSTVFVNRREFSTGPAVCFTALAGLTALFPNDYESMILVPPGFMTCLDIATGNVVLTGVLEGTALRPLTPGEAANFNRIIGLLPENILHYLPPIIEIIGPSGIGLPLPSIIIIGGPGNVVAEACRTGLLPPTVCQILGL